MINIKEIKASDLWYIIGYIAADGSLSIDGRHIIITSKDREHLVKIKNTLKSKNKIGIKYRSLEKIKEYFHLQLGDKHFYDYLLKIGFTPNKSLTVGEIAIEDIYFNDFLRGVIDGDGNISTWTHRTNLHVQWCLRIFSGSKMFLIWINKKIFEHFGVEGKLYTNIEKNKTNPLYVLKIGKKKAYIILKHIYLVNSLYLERKMIQAQLCLQDRHKNVKLSEV